MNNLEKYKWYQNDDESKEKQAKSVRDFFGARVVPEGLKLPLPSGTVACW